MSRVSKALDAAETYTQDLEARHLGTNSDKVFHDVAQAQTAAIVECTRALCHALDDVADAIRERG